MAVEGCPVTEAKAPRRRSPSINIVRASCNTPASRPKDAAHSRACRDACPSSADRRWPSTVPTTRPEFAMDARPMTAPPRPCAWLQWTHARRTSVAIASSRARRPWTAGALTQWIVSLEPGAIRRQAHRRAQGIAPFSAALAHSFPIHLPVATISSATKGTTTPAHSAHSATSGSGWVAAAPTHCRSPASQGCSAMKSQPPVRLRGAQAAPAHWPMAAQCRLPTPARRIISANPASPTRHRQPDPHMRSNARPKSALRPLPVRSALRESRRWRSRLSGLRHPRPGVRQCTRVRARAVL